tara:strand:- start:12044 stop:13099 length:1056 start_codon:yes stop_codon:yes gene_type:complete
MLAKAKAGLEDLFQNLFCSIIVLVLLAGNVTAHGLTFAMIPKGIDDPNLLQAWYGCKAAAKERGDTCLLLGDTTDGYFRGQLDAIRNAIDRRVDGIMISVTRSDFIAPTGLAEARKANIPVITYDSDLTEPYQGLRILHVGNDNFSVGLELAALLRQSMPHGRTLCILSSGRDDPNLNRRIAGVRHGLREPVIDHNTIQNTPDTTETSEPLAEGTGWIEYQRCPLYNKGDQRVALTQLKNISSLLGIDAVIAVGSWLVDDSTLPLQSLLQEFGDHRPLLLMATGTLSPEQEQLVHSGLVQGYVTIDFFKMGELSYTALRNIVDQHTALPIPELPLKIMRYTEEDPKDRPEM